MTLAPYDKFKPGNVQGSSQKIRTPFVISMCILGDLPQFYMFPWKYVFFLQNGKEARKLTKE
jgi:hypothetical protein